MGIESNFSQTYLPLNIFFSPNPYLREFWEVSIQHTGMYWHTKIDCPGDQSGCHLGLFWCLVAIDSPCRTSHLEIPLSPVFQSMWICWSLFLKPRDRPITHSKPLMTLHLPGHYDWFEDRHTAWSELLRHYGTLQGILDKRQLDSKAEHVSLRNVTALFYTTTTWSPESSPHRRDQGQRWIKTACLLKKSGTSLMAQLVKNLPAMWETWVRSLGWEDPLEKGKATHSSILAWRIPWTIQSMGSQRVGHDWATFTFTFWKDQSRCCAEGRLEEESSLEIRE